MKEKPRYIENAIKEDALDEHKIVCVSGPRQVGEKTFTSSY